MREQRIVQQRDLLAAAARIRFPEWFPEPLHNIAREIFVILVTTSSTAYDKGLFSRLIADKRMKVVWKELLRRRRTGDKITTYLNSTIDHQSPREMRDETPLQHASLVALFARLLHRGVDLGEMHVSSNPKWPEWEAAAAKLRKDAVELRGQGKGAIADRLLEAALAYDDLVGNPTPFERMGNNAEARTWTLSVAVDMIELFGSPLYRTTATIVSVVLDQEVTIDSAREWIKNPIRWGE